MIGRKLVSLVIFGAVLLPFSPAWADTEINAVPTAWRLQNYAGSTLAAYYTGSTCASGSIQFSSAATSDDKNRFYALVLTAKITGKTIGVFYETTSGLCQITSFYIQS